MKKRYWKPILVAVLLIIIVLVTGYFVLRYSTYEYTEIVKTYENDSTSNGSYIQYADGILEYSKDGIALLSKEGKEIWNQPCQMSNPVVKICRDIATVADKGGTSIYVFQKNGLKGEIQTTKPIEKITVSAQGIVAAILQDEETPWVMCYDAKGNVLVEHKASLTNTGYPVDLALSQDGNVLLVSYLYTRGTGVVTKASFYHFGEAGQEKEDHLVAQKEYTDTIAPTAVFLDKDTSLLVSDRALIFYEGLDEPKESEVVELDKEIKSIAYDEKYVALVLKNSSGSEYELRLYRANGKQVMAAEFEGEYTSIKIAKEQVLLYNGNKCIIFNDAGVCKFEGTLEMHIMDMFPVTGLSKYMVISANGFQEIQLAK
ncbi:MAG: hypothetical protein IJ439_05990 [Tyzzerella sp.]|nr:hypothetical protein [Tyzzerella sp.]